MKITIYNIAKEENDPYYKIIKEFEQFIGRFAKFSNIYLMNKEILHAQTLTSFHAQASYTKAFEGKGEGVRIALDPRGKILSTEEFSKMLDRSEGKLTFFIGGAYGLENSFVQTCDKTLSLSKLTLSHKLAHLVLMEQIYRGLTLLHNHPYHK